MAFSTISATTPWNSLLTAREIYAACKHRQAAVLATRGFQPNFYATEPVVGTNVYAFVRNVQLFLDEVLYYQYFKTPGEVLSGVSDWPSSTLASTWGTPLAPHAPLRTDMQMTAARWRRIAKAGTPPGHSDWSAYTWPGYSYGQIQLNDIAGPWLWDDIIAVLQQCTRITSDASANGDSDDVAHTASQSINDPTPDNGSYAPLPGTLNFASVEPGSVYNFSAGFSRTADGSSGGVHTFSRKCSYYAPAGVTSNNFLVTSVTTNYGSTDCGLAVAQALGASPVADNVSFIRQPFSSSVVGNVGKAMCGTINPLEVSIAWETLINIALPSPASNGDLDVGDGGFRLFVADYSFPDGPEEP